MKPNKKENLNLECKDKDGEEDCNGIVKTNHEITPNKASDLFKDNEVELTKHDVTASLREPLLPPKEGEPDGDGIVMTHNEVSKKSKPEPVL